MAPRIKPGEGTLTGRTDASRPNEANKPKTDSDLGQRRQRGDIKDGFGLPVKMAPHGGCELSYRIKSTDQGEHRRYYIGFVQFAFVRFDSFGSNKAITCHLTGQDDVPEGRLFEDEDELNTYLRKQLVLA